MDASGSHGFMMFHAFIIAFILSTWSKKSANVVQVAKMPNVFFVKMNCLMVQVVGEKMAGYSLADVVRALSERNFR